MTSQPPLNEQPELRSGPPRRTDQQPARSVAVVAPAVDRAGPPRIECGQVLTEAKALVAHGQWLPWLSANTQVDERTARRWMRFAKNAEAVLAKSATSADLTFAEIDRDLSASASASEKMPDDLRDLADQVSELRKGGNVLADSVTFELLMAIRAKGARHPQASLSRPPGADRLRRTTP